MLNCRQYSYINALAAAPTLIDSTSLCIGKDMVPVRFLNKFLRIKKNITTIGVAFSFQKYNKLPVTNLDIKLNYILTEKGLKK